MLIFRTLSRSKGYLNNYFFQGLDVDSLLGTAANLIDEHQVYFKKTLIRRKCICLVKPLFNICFAVLLLKAKNGA